ncbi:BlaI/MecI/CopY family transcriptional regulator, partial [Caproicibacter fermentans]|uniref:BlaI/MecI/CopY family transcriptional regulator n=1 Tax=Caproicibacter fermentans TaxID=2576756 RepID=UPI0012EE1A65
MKSRNYVKLTNRELEIMKVLWKSNNSLTATEISELTEDSNFSIFSVQNTIKSLLSKKVIEVSSYTKVYKTNAREYKPLLSANDFATMQFTHYFDPSKETAIPHLVATL